MNIGHFLPSAFVVAAFTVVLDRTELEDMNDNNDGLDINDARLIHFHVCVHCGHPRRRDEVEGLEVNSGILHCPACGLEGPLNIEVRRFPGSLP